MTRLSLLLPSIIATIVVIAALAYAANSGGQGDQTVENALAVQKAMLLARDYLTAGDAKKAVEVLEANLNRINGDRKYLALLRDAYHGHIKDLAFANQHAQSEVFQKRLRILEDNESARQFPALLQAAPTGSVQPAAAMVLPLPSAHGPSTTPSTSPALLKQPRTDPFAAANEVKAPGSVGFQPQAHARNLLAQADEEFRQKRYAAAKRLYEQAHQADAAVLGEEGRRCWAYCQLDVVIEAVNRAAEQPCDWNKMEADVKNAVAVAPHLTKAGDDILGSIAKRRAAGAGTFRAAMPAVAVKHTPKRPDGWQLAETSHFRIFHKQTAAYAESVAEIAETTRARMSHKWFGKDLGEWSPKCDVYLYPGAADYQSKTGQHTSSPGHSKIDLDPKYGRVVVREMHLRCDNPTFLEAVLPHETTHVVLAGQFGTHHVPRWLDEGIAVLTEPAEKVQQHRQNLYKGMQGTQQLIPLKELLQLDNYPAPAKIGVFYAESVALVDFLAKQKGPVVVTQFVRDALQEGYESALKRHYGYQSINELQDRFTEGVLAEMNTLPASGGQ